MRVLHVQKVHGMGGSERHLLDLVPGLCERGVDATFCALVEPGAEEFVARLDAAGVPTRVVPAGGDVNPWLAARLARVVRAVRPDLVHTHLVHADTYGLVGAAAARTGSVRSVHNTVPELARQPYLAAARLAGRLARRTIAISQHARRYVLDHRMARPDRVRVVRYGIDVERWYADENARRTARADLAVAPDEVVVGVASRMVAHKGHDVLLDAFARAVEQAPHLRLVVAGEGALRPQLEARARPLGDTVRFVGHLDPGRIEPFMHACDVLSFPSLAAFGEGFGLAALEASAAGRPVVASDVASLPEIVVDGETGLLVPAGDATALAGALVALAEDPDARARMGDAGRARARDEFSIATMVDETIAVYEEARRVTEPLAGLRIGHLGRQPGCTRDRIVAKALRRAGADVVDFGVRARFPTRWRTSARSIRRGSLDAVVVSTLSHADVPVDRLLGAWQRVPVVFDASIALYESQVESRNVVRAGTPTAWWLALQDRLACRLANRVLVDTDAHRSYLCARTGTPASRFSRVWLGADDELLQPRPRRPGAAFRVLFYSTYSPLHGAEHIVRAAALLPRDRHLEVLMVGSGHTDVAVRRLAEELGVTTIRFSGRVPFAELPALIASSDVCLGVFGTVPPAARVIPFKVFDALAMSRPVVTADTPAAREALVDGTHCRLCPPGDPAALAAAITALRDDPGAATAMAARGHELYRERFSIDAQARDLGAVFRELVA